MKGVDNNSQLKPGCYFDKHSFNKQLGVQRKAELLSISLIKDFSEPLL